MRKLDAILPDHGWTQVSVDSPQAIEALIGGPFDTVPLGYACTCRPDILSTVWALIPAGGRPAPELFVGPALFVGRDHSPLTEQERELARALHEAMAEDVQLQVNEGVATLTCRLCGGEGTCLTGEAEDGLQVAAAG